MIRLPKFIRSLVGCCDAASSRYALGGVKVEAHDGVAHLVATDGRILVNVSYQEDGTLPGNEAIVAGKALATAFGSVAKAKCDERLDLSTVKGVDGQDRAVALVSGRKAAVPAAVEVVEGRFPRWRDVFPDMAPTFSIRLDCELLAQVCKVFAEAGTPRATFHFTDAGSALRIDAVAPTGEVIRAVVMPVGAENGGSLSAPLPEAKPRAAAKAG